MHIGTQTHIQGPQSTTSTHTHPSPQSPGLTLTWCKHCQASWGLYLAQGVAGQATVDTFIAGTHSLDLQPACDLKPLGSTPELEPEVGSAGSF